MSSLAAKPLNHADRRAVVVLAIAFAVLGPVAVYARLGMVPLLVVTLGAQSDLKTAVATLRAGLRLPEIRLVLVFFAWCAVSAAWASTPDYLGIVRLGAIGAMVALLFARVRGLDASAADRAAFILMIGGLGLFLLEAEEVISGGAILAHLKPDRAAPLPGQYEEPIMQIASRGAAVLAPLCFPIAMSIRTASSRAWPAILFVAAALAVCARTTMDASWLAILCGAIAFAITRQWPRFAIAGFFAGFVLYTLIAPAMSYGILTLDHVTEIGRAPWRGIEQRIGIWHYTAGLVAARPVLGYGFGSARVIAGWHDVIPRSGGWPALPLHPHNAVMQIWLELGAVGAMIAALLAASAGRRLMGLAATPEIAACAMATIAASLVIALASFSLWQFWWLSTLGIAAAGTVLAARAHGRNARDRGG